MKKNTLWLAGVACLFLAAALLAGCYAPLADQKGYLKFDLRFGEGARSGTSEVIVLVVDSSYGDAFKETLNLIGKAYENGSLSGTDSDRLTTLAKQLATSGLVKFGGFPFYQTTIDPSGGSFQIPGVPAGRDYFVKFFVFDPGFSFSVEDLDQHFPSHIQLENPVFSPSDEIYVNDTAWQAWTPVAGQPVSVSAGQSATINVTLGPLPS